MSVRRQTVAIDFDGVIHAYSRGWQPDGSIYDEPVEGAFPGIAQLMEEYNVFIFSSRNPEQIQDWLILKGFSKPIEVIQKEEGFWNTPGVLGITKIKFPLLIGMN